MSLPAFSDITPPWPRSASNGPVTARPATRSKTVLEYPFCAVPPLVVRVVVTTLMSLPAWASSCSAAETVPHHIDVTPSTQRDRVADDVSTDIVDIVGGDQHSTAAGDCAAVIDISIGFDGYRVAADQSACGAEIAGSGHYIDLGEPARFARSHPAW